MPVELKLKNTTSTADHLLIVPDATLTEPGVVTLAEIQSLIPPPPPSAIKERQAVVQLNGTRITHVWAVPFADANYFPVVQVFNAIGGITPNIDPASVTPIQCDILLSAPMDGELVLIAYPSS